MCLWTADDAAHVVFDGHSDPGTAERLERVLDLLDQARARHVTVRLARMTGPHLEVLELLAAHWHRPRTQQPATRCLASAVVPGTGPGAAGRMVAFFLHDGDRP